MKKGYLSQYFDGVAFKRLSRVEVDSNKSNQHEFNGASTLRIILGANKCTFDTKFIYLNDSDEILSEQSTLTWYDAREKARLERGVNRSEYRLYFPSNLVTASASEGDLLLVGKRPDNTLLAIVAEKDSTIERQMIWLFGISNIDQPKFAVKNELEAETDKISFATKIILEQIGIEVEQEDEGFLEEILQKFNGAFPKTIDFSTYARSTLPDIYSVDNPDMALISWMEREEVLYKTLEKYLLTKKLKELISTGNDDTDKYISIVQSTLQRRKARAGSALENHLEQVFTEHKITYSRNQITENRLRPDFIFPSINYYHNASFPENNLTMLGVKSTCKDRWRQVINEAARIPNKHLLTLEPSISENQTNEMKMENIQLVLPSILHDTYTDNQRKWLMNLSDFLNLAIERQHS